MDYAHSSRLEADVSETENADVSKGKYRRTERGKDERRRRRGWREEEEGKRGAEWEKAVHVYRK